MRALNNVSLDVRPGDLLAIVGENGAGKTTLMNVLYGLYQPDAGDIFIGGELVHLRSPKDAIGHGIGMVHQHFMLVPTLTVVENVILGAEPSRRGLIDFPAARAQVEATCRRFGFALDMEARVGDLSVGSQQKVEIVKALHRRADVLIMDEPTAVLTPQETDELFAVVRQLSRSGHSILFISHKLKEVLAIAARIAVMRQGELAAEVTATTTSPQGLAELMVGESAQTMLNESGGVPASGPPSSPPTPPSQVIALENAEVTTDDGRRALRGVTLSVSAGEVVGVAGVDGNGQRELAEIISGLRQLDGGKFSLIGKDATRLGPGELRNRGVSHIPEDRFLRAIVPSLTVEENASLGRQGAPPFARGVFINFAERKHFARKLLDEYDVRPRDESLAIALLSGGNQQKVVVGRELSFSPKLILAVQPTRGLDVGALGLVHERIRRAKRDGAAVLLISLDLDEVLFLSDRIVVLYDGRITGTFGRENFDERAIGRCMLGTEPGQSGGGGVRV